MVEDFVPLDPEALLRGRLEVDSNDGKRLDQRSPRLGLGRIELHILAGSSDPVSFSSADLQIPGKQDLPSTIDRTQGPALLIPLVGR